MTENFLLAGIIAIERFSQTAVKTLTSRQRETIKKKSAGRITGSPLLGYSVARG
jgi:hypothetical protein